MKLNAPSTLFGTFWLCALLLLPGGVCASEALGANVHAQIRVKGSDTLAKLLKEWAHVYQTQNQKNPIRIEVSGGGSGNGIAALLNGHVEIAASSRLLRDREVLLFTKKHIQAAPVAHVVAQDAVTILVHPSNPINGLSLPQLTEIYSKGNPLLSWSSLGVRIPGCPDQKIQPISRKNNSGTYLFFRQAILNKNEQFDPQLLSLDASDGVVNMVAQMPCAIGYSGMAFVTNAVKTLCISTLHEADAPCVPPTTASTVDHTYPLSRSLYLYTLGEPQGEIKKFLEWIRSAAGQEILTRNGYIPPPP
ncbi:MAG: phosphate ABC transporter substrate-binding protein [Magnetococcales bacterium]|nr:phosphate ABC transporter substrate-binding protein [Magnetococcales bacterium]